MRKIALLIFLVVLAFQTFAQDKPVAVKFAEFDDEKMESTEVFLDRLESFLKKISESPKTTFGFIAVSGKTHSILIARMSIVNARVKQDLDLKRRVEISRLGVKYDKDWEKTEFWLIPPGATRPYNSNSSCDCRSLSIQGKEKLDDKAELLIFSTDYSSVSWNGDPITFKWSVIGGTIIKGQGTSVITVRRNHRERKEITASIEIGGTDEDCHCTTTASFTTRIIPQ